ncbi:hypothetical protein [Clostridium lacusfryxellense]|uniref:hypothetical protein n=1 Tax=Clostridium lacusfryxellense TaxID=205328 RepID=UPI001C0BCD78|nr:hypothetical protein [Clostridium lacusfryxellense]MBU3113991.1 hypothetical protein [Clostridium lacusfryxellense]
MKNSFKTRLIFTMVVLLSLGLTACGLNNKSKDKVVNYTKEEVNVFQKTPETIIKTYYADALPLYQSAEPDEKGLSRLYSLIKICVANTDKSEEVYVTQVKNNIIKTFKTYGKLLDYKISEPVKNLDGSTKITVVEQYEKRDLTSVFNLKKENDLWYIYKK